MNLPQFKYHPDPIATGSVKPSEARCECCGKYRGYIYTPAIYGINDLEHVCPWCIADDTAHANYGAEFSDAAGVGGYVSQTELPKAVVEEIAYRTPGFIGWQQEEWLTCCGHAAAFVGHAGTEELERDWPDAMHGASRPTSVTSTGFSATVPRTTPTSAAFPTTPPTSGSMTSVRPMASPTTTRR